MQDFNKCVAISEEYANDMSSRAKSGGLLFDRRIARIVTPGTLVDENFINPCVNNFLLALHPRDCDISHRPFRKSTVQCGESLTQSEDEVVGLAWLDLSTGDFFTRSIQTSELSSSMERIAAKEIVMSSNLCQEMKDTLRSSLGVHNALVTWQQAPDGEPTAANWAPVLDPAAKISERKDFSYEEVYAGSLLLNYVKDKIQGQELKLQGPIRQVLKESMGIDKNTIRGLELLETSRDGTSGGKGTLLYAIKRTVTSGGARLLRYRLSYPSTSVAIIQGRLDLAEHLINNTIQREAIVSLLRQTEDTQRIMQKFILKRGDADDLLNLQRTIRSTQNIVELLKEVVLPYPPSKVSNDVAQGPFAAILSRISLSEPLHLADGISAAIDEDSLLVRRRNDEAVNATAATVSQSMPSSAAGASDLEVLSQAEDGAQQEVQWIMKKTASRVLRRLHDDLCQLMEDKRDLGMSLRNRLGATSLTLRWSPALGHVCHIKGSKDIRASHERIAAAKNASISKTTKSFYSEEWSDLGTRIDHLKLHISNEEQRIFHELRKQVVDTTASLRQNATALDELDVACSSAILAAEQKLVRPIVSNSRQHQIIAGRHATVKVGLEEKGRSFVANDCSVGKDQRIWLITGPNMAGKSTFLRQNALITILAQVGSYVPAEYAEIGVVDQMFSRIGAADNLYQGQSTFMVEMLETASILKLATPQSFVIMDEVGRGTTPEDGIAVAFACLHHLCNVNQCRTLFATHFHKLVDMTQDWSHVGTYCNDLVEEDSGVFHFIHRLRPGVNRNSQALKVAQLAGIPRAAVDVAAAVLRGSEK